MSSISFANAIGSIPSPTISQINIGPFGIHFYALFIIAGIFAAGTIGHFRLKQRGAVGLEVIDIALWAVPIGILGARLVHVLTHLNDYFGEGRDPLAAFRIWEGGLAIYGALIFGALGAFVGARLSGVNFLAFADAIAPGLLIAQAIGRLGNYFNQELFGAPTDLPWGIQIDKPDAIPVGLPYDTAFHPTFAYEAILSLIGAAILIVADRMYALRNGRLIALYLVWYSACRFFIEGMRIDPSNILFGLRTFQWFAILGVVAGLALFYWQTKVRQASAKTVYFREPEPEEDSAMARVKKAKGEEYTSAE
jgi:prolipoprotein diacylglyceryl transferase